MSISVQEPERGESLTAANALMGRRSQIACVWITVASVGLAFVGFFIVSGYVPPRAANDSAQQIAQFYADNTTRLRIGLLLTIVAWAGWMTLVAAVATQMLRIERRRPVLSILQLGSGVTGFVFLLVPTIVLVVATFRPGRSPEITQALHDLGWILAFLPFVPFCVQAVAIGAATLQDRAERPVFPRWFGYLNFWIALLFAPGCLLPFFKSGAFSYQGLFVFWIPFVVFGAWMLILAWGVRRAVLIEHSLAAEH